MSCSKLIALLLLGALLLPRPAFADGEEPSGEPAAVDPAPAEPEVKEATSKEFRHERKMFERDFDTPDIDFKLDALIRFSRCIHEDVAKDLVRIVFKDPDPYVRAEAAKGLRHQVLWPEMIGKKLHPLLSEDDLDPKVLAEVVLTIGAMNYTKAWGEIVDLMAHDDDKVVVNVFFVLGEWKELRACLEIQGFWDAYPTEGNWSTGSVTVDTGADTATEQRLAKAKWKAKYGGRVKQRARPDCVKALKVAVKKMTGEALETPAEFRVWRSDHQEEIRAAKRKRD